MSCDDENKLRDFLIELSNNEKLRKKFAKCPDEVMKRFGLSDEEQQWIRDGNTDAIDKALGDSYFSSNWVHVSRK